MQTSDSNGTPSFRGLTWSRNSSDFATRIEISDVGGLFNQEVIIEPGTSAILISDGATLGVTPPGRYTLSSTGDKLRGLLSLQRGKQVSAIVVDTNDLDLSFRVARAYTKDPIGVAVEVRVVLCVPGWSDQGGAPKLMEFFMNVMKGSRRFTIDDLISHLQPEVENGVQEYLQAYTVTELSSSQQRKAALEEAVLAHLERTVNREGFVFKGVRALRIVHERLDAATQQKEELLLLDTEEGQKLQKRRKLLDVLKENDILELAEETQRIEMHERRSALSSRMRRSVLSEEFDQMKTDDELAAYIDRMDYTRALRQDERDRRLAELREAREDRLAARARLVARLTQEAEYEDALVALRRKSNLRQEEFDLQAEYLRKEMERGFDLQLRNAQNEVQLARVRADAERDRRMQIEADNRLRELDDARNSAEVEHVAAESRLRSARTEVEKARARAEIERIDIDTQQMKVNMALTIKERNYAIERENDAQKEIRRLESRQAEMRMDIEKQQAEHRMAIERAAQAASDERERVRVFSAFGVHGLMAISGPDQARLIAELQKTEAYSKMTADQIQMLMAGDSATMAQALIERYKAQAQDKAVEGETRALYERLITMAGQMRPDQTAEVNALRTAMADQKSLAEKLAEMIQNTAIGVTRHVAPQGPTTPSIVVIGSTPATSGVQTLGTSGIEREIKPCPRCGHKNNLTVQFCANCHHKYFD